MTKSRKSEGSVLGAVLLKRSKENYEPHGLTFNFYQFKSSD